MDRRLVPNFVVPDLEGFAVRTDSRTHTGVRHLTSARRVQLRPYVSRSVARAAPRAPTRVADFLKAGLDEGTLAKP